MPGSTTPKLITAQTVKAVKTGAMSQAHGMKYRGRKPTFSREQFTLVRELLDQGIAVSAIAKTTALKRQSIYRIQAEPERQLAALLAWYPSEVVKQTARTFQSLTRRLRQASKRRPGLPRPTRRSGKRRASLIAPSLARAREQVHSGGGSTPPLSVAMTAAAGFANALERKTGCKNPTGAALWKSRPVRALPPSASALVGLGALDHVL